MRKTLTIVFAIFSGAARAQFGVSDSVSLGAGYMNEAYYNLQTMSKTYVPKMNWELGFQTNLMEAGILANHSYGVTVYQCPNTDIPGFLTLDTAGISTWASLYNSDAAWSQGALNAGRDTSNLFDFGWGVYDFGTHSVNGDSVFVVKLSGTPDEYRKLYIQQKTDSGNYIFRYANLDNTGDVTTTLYVSNFAGKNFGYFSLRNDSALDREPLSADWDILFTRYYTYVASAGFYPVTGVLSNIGVEVAQAGSVDLLTVNPANYINLYSNNISEIGYDWKTYNTNTMSYDLEDSLCYFVKSQNGNINRIVFTGFDGGATGNIFFQVLSVPTAINEGNSGLRCMALYPNVTSTAATLVFSSNRMEQFTVTIHDMNGRKVMHQNFAAGAGLNQKQLNVNDLSKGIYTVRLENESTKLVQKLIVE